jgi:hypothetical protein
MRVLGEISKVSRSINRVQELLLSNISSHRRYQSRIIPITVGPQREVFYVHRAILLKTEYFRRALEGDFREAATQTIDLPEEQPSLFSFIVAFLYENKYVPVKAASEALGTVWTLTDRNG